MEHIRFQCTNSKIKKIKKLILSHIATQIATLHNEARDKRMVRRLSRLHGAYRVITRDFLCGSSGSRWWKKYDFLVFNWKKGIWQPNYLHIFYNKYVQELLVEVRWVTADTPGIGTVLLRHHHQSPCTSGLRTINAEKFYQPENKDS